MNPNPGVPVAPPPMDWLPTGYLAYFILEIVEELDLIKIEENTRQKDPRGEPPYAPKMMTALLLYGYCVGVYSSRRIARGTYEDVAFRVIAGGEHPHFTTINQFRLYHRGALAGLFVQVLQMCQRAGLVKLGHVALDGTKIKAAASKAQGVSNQPPDQQYLVPMVERMLGICEQTPEALLADSGYFSQQNVEHLQKRNLESYIAVGREGTTAALPTQASTPTQRLKASMGEKLSKGKGKIVYSRRKAIVEPVFGQIEQARGFRRFSQRGHGKVRCEWAFVCLTHNLLKLFRHLAGGSHTARWSFATWTAG